MLKTNPSPISFIPHCRGLRTIAFCSPALWAIFAPNIAYAAGTLAGTDITNIASASYESGGSTVVIDSNPVIIKVDELLDVTAVSGDPTLVQVIRDTKGNGVYDSGVDTIYVAGTNDPVLSPDQIITVLTNVTTTQSNGDCAQVRLTAAATTGTGAPRTTFAGTGQGGGNAVVGFTGADDDQGGLTGRASVSRLSMWQQGKAIASLLR